MVQFSSTTVVTPKLLLALLLALVNTFAADAYTSVASISFDKGTNGFKYADDTFLNTNNGKYVFGQHLQERLSVLLGGKDNRKITDMSGGWKRSFTLAQASKDVKIAIRYELETRPSVDSNENVAAMASFGGKSIGSSGGSGYLESIAGQRKKVNYRTPVRTFTANLGPFSAGTHELILGGFMDSKNKRDEQALVWFSGVSISADYVPATKPTTKSPTKAPTMPPTKEPTKPQKDSSLKYVPVESVNFSKSPEGFKFVGDVDSNDQAPTYASGVHQNNRLSILLGGVDNESAKDMSGWWEYTIDLPRNMANVQVSFTYELEMRPQVEVDSIVQVKAKLGGKVMTGSNLSLAVDQLKGKSLDNNVVTQTETFTTDLGSFKKGSHKLLLGGYLNKKDAMYEQCLVWFKSVKVTAGY